MKIKEILEELEIIFNINEMALNRDKAIQTLLSYAEPYETHICKIMLWGNQSEKWLKDWSDELFNYCSKIAKIDLKGNKRLKEKDYDNNFFYANIEATWELTNKLKSCRKYFEQKEKYPKPNYVIIVEDLFEQYKKFLKAIKPMVITNDMDYEQFLEASKILIGGNQ